MRLFSDQKTLLLRSYQGAAQGAGQNMEALADEAINQAYRKIAGCLPWSYLHRRTQINTVACQRTGSLAYNSSTNVLTLSGATFPSWASQGEVIINSTPYAIQDILSSTTASLKSDRRPSADVAAGTAYTMFQREYVLPADFLKVEDLVVVGNVWITQEIKPGSLLQTERIFYNPCRPWYFMVRGSQYFAGRESIVFAPPPDAAYTYDMVYFAMPRQRTMNGESTKGTIAISGSSVTGTGTAFTSAMVGCWLRVGTASAVPTGEFGPTGSLVEYQIASVADSTHLTLETPGVTVSGVQYLIDDPVDIERMSMDEAFCRICEYELSVLLRDYKLGAQKEALMIKALENARARDVRMSDRLPIYTTPDWRAVAFSSLGGR